MKEAEKRHIMNGHRRLGVVQVSAFVGLLLTCALPVRAEDSPTGLGANDPAARFHGAPAYDLLVTNVSWQVVNKDYTEVTFDLSWSFSWRAKWTEPATNNVTGKPLEVENWDAAWVFVKFLPEKDSTESIESNRWQHATLDTDPSHHVMPAGATNTVGTTDDGARGMGVFIYRDAIGHGRNDWKGIKLRWLHPADTSGRFDPAKAAVKVHTIAMVYVPEGAFKVGSGSKTRIAPFSDGIALPVLHNENDEFGSFTDGSWRGGPVVPFMVDAAWNGPVAEGTCARRIGPVAGQLWGLAGYSTHYNSGQAWPYSCAPGAPGVLCDDYPTGYNAFYCMKYTLTQGQYADFLNALPREVAAARATVPEGEVHMDPAKPYSWEVGGNTITAAGVTRIAPKPKQVEVGDETPDLETDKMLASLEPVKKGPNFPPVYTARVPHRMCNYLNWQDGFAYAGWAGLRPMSELEFEKACRGPLNPVPNEHAWGSTAMTVQTNLQDAGLTTEHYETGNCQALVWRSSGEAVRAGIFATPDSDRVAAGASYWGVLSMEAATFAIPVGTTGAAGFPGSDAIPAGARNGRAFRGSHGDGRVPSGAIPGPAVPSDWAVPGGRWGLQMGYRGSANTPCNGLVGEYGYGGGRWYCSTWRGVRTAGVRPVRVASAPAAPVSRAKPETVFADVAHDTIRITNVTWKTGASDDNTVTFDLAWDNSWRAKWEEPAEKNVTGKPLKVESWDAAWVFVKFLDATHAKSNLWQHAVLDADAARHQAPAGAALDVGLNDDGANGIGVFIYRDAPGSGPIAYKGVTLKWQHPSSSLNPDPRPPITDLRVHAIPMVYVPQGPFKTKGPWGHPLSPISNGDATKAGGYRVGQSAEGWAGWGANCLAVIRKRRLEAGTAPKSDAWPNGYGAFYCMKYSISQGQYADFLNSLPVVQDELRYYCGYNINRFSIRRVADQGVYTAEVPDRACNFLGSVRIYAYTAWAGLRPITDLEYEKACRGPREVASEADAWGAAVCAPASGLPINSNAGSGTTAAASPPSYWGIRELSLSGIPFEWPWVVRNEPGFLFKGTHGEGALAGPADFSRPQLGSVGWCFWASRGDGVLAWPADWPLENPVGDVFGDWLGWGHMIGFWLVPSDMSRIWEVRDAFGDRTGRYGSHAARTAPVMQDKDSPLQVNPLPHLIGCDIGIFELAGQFKNAEDKPLRVELETTLPESCFPGGAASRAFTAAPKVATPFKILTVLSGDVAVRAAQNGGRTLPVRIRIPGGDVLAEQSLDPRIMVEPKEGSRSAIASLTGGEVALRITNTANRAFAMTVEIQPLPGITMPATSRRVEIAPYAAARVSYPVPRQGFTNDGLFRIPYRVVVSNGVPQNGEVPVVMRSQARWWVSIHKKAGPETGADSGGPSADGLDVSGITEGAGPTGVPGGLFKRDKPPEGWRPLETYVGVIPFGSLGSLPSHGSSVMAVTRLLAPADGEAFVHAWRGNAKSSSPPAGPRFSERVWINDKLVFDSTAVKETDRAKAFPIRKGVNTMQVECKSKDDAPVTPGDVSLPFNDAKSGALLNDLIFDMSGGGK
ncbi:MAG: hypothetical protein WCS01_04430 [bacterium]